MHASSSVRASLLFVLLFSIFALPLSAATIRGMVELGNDAFPGLTGNKYVVLYEANRGAPIVRGFAKTEQDGSFELKSTVKNVDGILYLQAYVGFRFSFICVLGDTLPPVATVNELTTVAGAYSMAQFLRTGSIIGSPFALNIAAGMNRNLVNPLAGRSSRVLTSSPNADQTNSWRMTHSLANLLNLCAINRYVNSWFLNLTTAEGDEMPADNVAALANLARDPGRSVGTLYSLSGVQKAYRPFLRQQPDAWCVTVKVNDSGSDTFLIGGPANVAFDSYGYAWIANNVNQGSTESGNYIVVLKPDGSPADGKNGTPTSPIFGGGLLGGGWGVFVDRNDTVWASNFGWGGSAFWPDPEPGPGNTGSVSTIRAEDGTVLSQPSGLFGGVWRAQTLLPDDFGNVWIASFQNDSLVLWPGGDPAQAQSAVQYEGAAPFGLTVNPDNTVWVANSGGLFGESGSSLAKYGIVDGVLTELIPPFPVGDNLRTVVNDSKGNAWAASVDDDTIYAIAPDGTVLGAYQGGGIFGPWGLAIDGEENIWVSNFGALAFDPFNPQSRFQLGRLSKICGSNPDAWPAGKSMGDPISPPSGYTVPSAGQQVLLSTGEPLYGSPFIQTFVPMMRQTAVQIDAAGNAWSINNWKPDTDINVSVNPGGDGVVIFVGIAPPPRHWDR